MIYDAVRICKEDGTEAWLKVVLGDAPKLRFLVIYYDEESTDEESDDEGSDHEGSEDEESDDEASDGEGSDDEGSDNEGSDDEKFFH
ncbi:hypothetical protein B9Z55_003702 [Caenorhabditis nigoni]|uniref:Uncharacterized protein n=1 Tax=Caenorhabditis nigoni TaxID=1611254 RepID=A0A2G5VS47_9PELO|nr:hypothetical protein B9Z55_003702 [Caenorhabditis nigoni]